MTDVQENTATAVPDQIEYHEDMVEQARAAKRSRFKTLKTGWMRAVVNKGFKRDKTSKGNLRITRRVSPVDASGRKVDGGSAKLEIYPTVPNPAVAGHKAPNTLFGNYCLARAMDPDFPRYPRKDGPNYLDADGGGIDSTAYEDLTKQVDSAVVKRSVELYNKPELMDNEVLFVLIEHDVGKNGEIYTRASRTRGEPPEDEPVITEDFFLED